MRSTASGSPAAAGLASTATTAVSQSARQTTKPVSVERVDGPVEMQAPACDRIVCRLVDQDDGRAIPQNPPSKRRHILGRQIVVALRALPRPRFLCEADRFRISGRVAPIGRPPTLDARLMHALPHSGASGGCGMLLLMSARCTEAFRLPPSVVRSGDSSRAQALPLAASSARTVCDRSAASCSIAAPIRFGKSAAQPASIVVRS